MGPFSSNPPATYVPSYGAYVTSCNATAPQFGVNIEGKPFYMNPADMFVEAAALAGVCATSITRGFSLDASLYPDGLYILGDVFLHNVVAVFDVGNTQMHFAPHTTY
jgi:Eukaryotic aspartyl protease